MGTEGQINMLSVKEAVSLIRKGEISCTDLLNSCLDRIDTYEEKIQAWALVDREGSQKQAQHLDREIKKGNWPGVLCGIPVGIKDIFYTAGMRTEAGSKLWKGFVPDYDAAAVSSLKKAGAIILGKTYTTEFAYFDPAPTRNPWNTKCTPGGSSSGSAAAVAACMCPLALGSQTVGSTLRPASYNGIVGLKPEHGRISTYGVMPMSWTMDHVGVFTRNVADAAIVLKLLAGFDQGDPYTLYQPVPDYDVFPIEKRQPRLGLPRKYFFDNAEKEMQQHVETVASQLSDAGASIEEVELPESFFNVSEIRSIILGVEDYAYHQKEFEKNKDRYSSSVRALLEDGSAIPAVIYAKALQTRLRQRTDIMRTIYQFDAFLTPGAPGPAPMDLTITGNPVMQLPWSTLGLPAIGIPSGLATNGLPLGIQLVSAPMEEKNLLEVASWCEEVLDFHLHPELF